MEEKIFNILESVISKLDLKLDSVVYEKEDNIYFLRIMIDSNDYVSVNDCVKVNQVINPILDELDLIKESYVLDVCSKPKEDK